MKPISYLQKDARWKNEPYRVNGETSTIGSAGCGPTSASMLIASLKDGSVTPKVLADWSMSHGYKALRQGTSYSYFIPQFKEYGIECKRLNTASVYGNTNSEIHNIAKEELLKGNILIACMGKGNWTSSGHYIVAYGYEDGNVLINDPASTKEGRLKNTWKLFTSQVKYYWSITIPEEFKQKVVENDKINPYPEPTKTVSYNSSIANVVREDVKWMQWELKRLGIYTKTIDGKFGLGTKKALDDFQKFHPETYYPKKLPDGDCGTLTRKALKGA